MEHYNPILGSEANGQKFITCGEIMLRTAGGRAYSFWGRRGRFSAYYPSPLQKFRTNCSLLLYHFRAQLWYTMGEYCIS